MLPAQYIVVGQLGRTFGLKGWIKVYSFTQPMENLLNYPQWFFCKNRFPTQLASTKKGEEFTEHSSGAYTSVCEETSTGRMKPFDAEVEFCKKTNDEWLQLPVDNAQWQSSNLIAHISGYDSPEAVRIFTGTEIAIPRTALPNLKKNEYFWCDLVGLTVVTKEGIELGKIDHLFSSGAHDIVVVRGEKEYLIPYVTGHFVLKVDLSQQQMIVDWDLTY